MNDESQMQLVPVRALSDNYVWCFHRADEQSAWVVDPGQAQPVIDFLEQHSLELAGILLTHHHPDHTAGVDALIKACWDDNSSSDCPVYGSRAALEAGRIKTITRPLDSESEFEAAGLVFRTMSVPGHTHDHVTFYCADGVTVNELEALRSRESASGAVPKDGRRPLLFSGDTLFSAGCGRLFEGTPKQMLESLDSLSALPEDTLVCCGHEYTVANLTFTQEAWPDNKAIDGYRKHCQTLRNSGEPTLPSSIGIEHRINPFLNPESTRHAAKADSRLDAFTNLRAAKDGA